MARSLKKGPFVDEHLLRKVEAAKDRGEGSVLGGLGRLLGGDNR